MGRKAVSAELNSEYFNDGLYYVKAMIHKLSVPTLFDLTKGNHLKPDYTDTK